MDTKARWVTALSSLNQGDEARAGGKASRLGALGRKGFAVPDGFCIPVEAYELFVRENDLDRIIRAELGRKSLSEMRWEELWDAALRIRSAFNASRIPSPIESDVRAGLARWPPATAFAVRSSAPGEDSPRFSFAGLHESRIGLRGVPEVLDAIRQVWSSLWSDAALLYRQEIGLDPSKSRMAVLVQPMVSGEKSGVAFGRDPRWPRKPQAVLEAVPGLCRGLVDGTVDPDRWILSRPTGRPIQWTPGNPEDPQGPVLSTPELRSVFGLLRRVEAACGWPPDMEWTQSRGKLVLLQARPMTKSPSRRKDLRPWYMSLKPGENRLRALCDKITRTLIPELERAGRRFSQESVETCIDARLAGSIRRRKRSLMRWRKIYHDDFIPFAHGVRQLATYYNDIVKPADPYEFVGLFSGEATRASSRMREMASLAGEARRSPYILRALRLSVSGPEAAPKRVWGRFVKFLGAKKAGARFMKRVGELLEKDLDLAYGTQSLRTRPDILLNMLRQMAEQRRPAVGGAVRGPAPSRRRILERRLYRLGGKNRKKETAETLRIGRLSWRLRDDDNVLLGCLESQLLRALSEGAKRLSARKRWPGRTEPVEEHAGWIAEALLDPKARPPFPRAGRSKESLPASEERTAEQPRQLVGQPVSPGLASGPVRRVSSPADMLGFQAGDVLVCDSIQPSITHLVPLASGIVERRGGMLMHGAIVARELGRPCVNGIPGVMEILRDGQQITVDGFLGIVTVGRPEFDLEKRSSGRP